MKRIYILPLGITNTYLIKGKKNILVDAGPKNKLKILEKHLSKHDLSLKDIHYVLLTHTHWDHMGSSAAIKEASGAMLLAHKNEAERAETGKLAKPVGYGIWGKLLQELMKLLLAYHKVEGCNIDMIIDQNEYSLTEIGIEARILFTPGHTPGSLSLVLDSGEAFVGDLAMGGFPRLKGKGMPVICEDPQQVLKSWQVLLDNNVKTIFPAHGVPFSSDILKKEIDNMKKSKKYII